MSSVVSLNDLAKIKLSGVKVCTIFVIRNRDLIPPMPQEDDGFTVEVLAPMPA